MQSGCRRGLALRPRGQASGPVAPPEPPLHPRAWAVLSPTHTPSQSITGAFDPDQRRTEDAMADEALTNKSESREALAFAGRLVAIPIVTGILIGTALAEPVLSFTLANNPDAFAMTGRQKIEGAARVHQEEARVRMLMAIGQAPPLNDGEMLQHLREYAHEVRLRMRLRMHACMHAHRRACACGRTPLRLHACRQGASAAASLHASSCTLPHPCTPPRHPRSSKRRSATTTSRA